MRARMASTGRFSKSCTNNPRRVSAGRQVLTDALVACGVFLTALKSLKVLLVRSMLLILLDTLSAALCSAFVTLGVVHVCHAASTSSIIMQIPFTAASMISSVATTGFMKR